jgi:hypothetical protein
MDSYEIKSSKIGDPRGFCALWCIWYVDQRLTYSHFDRKKLVKILFENIKNNGISYRELIRNYSKYIVNIRDNLLSSINIDINDWLNENYTNQQHEQFIANLQKEINECCSSK